MLPFNQFILHLFSQLNPQYFWKIYFDLIKQLIDRFHPLTREDKKSFRLFLRIGRSLEILTYVWVKEHGLMYLGHQHICQWFQWSHSWWHRIFSCDSKIKQLFLQNAQDHDQIKWCSKDRVMSNLFLSLLCSFLHSFEVEFELQSWEELMAIEHKVQKERNQKAHQLGQVFSVHLNFC